MRTTLFCFLLLTIVACKNGSQKSNVHTNQADGGEPRIAEMIQLDINGSPIIKYTYIYNALGKIQSEQIWDSTSSGIGFKEKLYYYERDTLMTEMQFHDELGLVYKVINKYNDQGKLLTEESIDTSVYRRKTFSYDERWNVVKEESFERGQGTSVIDFTYSETDKLLTATLYGYDNKKIKSNTYTYENDTLTELFFFDANDELTHHWVYEYNEGGLLVAEKEKNKDGTLFIIKSYIYDQEGNKLVEEESKYQFYRIDYIYDENGRLKTEHHKNQVGNIQRIVNYK